MQDVMYGTFKKSGMSTESRHQGNLTDTLIGGRERSLARADLDLDPNSRK